MWGGGGSASGQHSGFGADCFLIGIRRLTIAGFGGWGQDSRRGEPGTDRAASEFPAKGAGNPWQSCQSPGVRDCGVFYDSIFYCISSSVMPAVSGNSSQTTKNWTTVITAKRTNGAGRDRWATSGKVKAMMAFMIQWVKLPRLWPLARTRLGNTSLR